MARGHRQTKATRKKISESLTAYYKEQFLSRDPAKEPTTKQCPKCKETKHVSEFHTEKYKTKSGLISVWPATYCKKCRNAEVQARRKRQAAEGVDVRARERRYKQRFKERHPEKPSEYQRESRRVRALREGKHVALGVIDESRQFVSAAPLAEFLAKEDCDRINVRGFERRLYAIAHGEQKKVELRVVDAILTGLGCPEEMNILYPPKQELVGYHVLDQNGQPLNSQ